jgi:hypothetical protein
MSRIVATAECNYLTGQPWPEATTITRQRADRFTMYAPGWRPMAFSSLDAAKAKLQRHPGFVAWRA